MRAIWTVLKKEIRENLRDRRALFNSVLLLPFLFPAIMLGFAYFSVSKQEARAEKILEIPVVGGEHAPNLLQYLTQQGMVVLPPVDDPEKKVRDQQVAVVLRIPANFADNWRKGDPAPVEVITDPSRRESATQAERLQTLLYSYGGLIGSLRVQLRGISPNLNTAVIVRLVDLSTPKSRAVFLILLLPYILMLTAFTGGLHLAIDTTAGERERHSLEPLFITPVPRWQIMIGKMSATSLFAFLSLVLTVISFKLTMPYMPIDQLGIDLNLPVETVGFILLIISPVAVFASALNTLLAAFAKSYREAQSYVGMVILIPMIPSVMLMSDPVKPETWLMPIPIFSQNLLIGELVRAEPINATWVALSVMGTLGIGLILMVVAAMLYNRPRLVFSGS